MEVFKKKVLTLSSEGKKQIRQEFHCSESTIYSALAYRSASEQARKIRARALELGAQSTNKVLFF